MRFGSLRVAAEVANGPRFKRAARDMRKLIADLLRVFVQRLDPSAEAKDKKKTSVPMKPSSIDNLAKPTAAIDVPEVAWNKSGWGNYL